MVTAERIRNKRNYNKEYKDQRRIVVYAKDADTKSVLIDYAEANGKTLSDLCEPKLKELADGIKNGTI